MRKIKKVSVIGLGYVGLPLLVAIAKSKKYEVVGFDLDKNKIKLIKSGQSPIQDETVEEFLQKTKLSVSDQEQVLASSDVFIVCVPTPVHDDHNPDYGPVISASKIAGKYLTAGTHFVLESTVNPGTCDEIVIPILEELTALKAGKDFNVTHCPERINPGDPNWSVYNIPRNIGSISKVLNKKIADFYRSFLPKATINEVESLKIAEATKIVENTFRDINIAYVNELAQSFDAMDIDLHQTLQAASNKPFGFMPHWPGCGVGGHCIAVDPYYLIRQAGKNGFDHKFLKLAREINNSMPHYCITRLVKALNEVKLLVKGTKIALLGLSYKADVGDIRESPSLEIESELIKLGAELTIYDKYFERSKKNLKKIVEQSEAIVIATAHKEIVEQLPELLKKSAVKVVIDGRNCLQLDEKLKKKIVYKGIGR